MKETDPGKQDKIIEKIKSDFTVCYSGGLDSTYVAYIMGLEHEGDAHLFTMVPHGQLFYKWAGKHVPDLERLLGKERVHHHYEDTKQLFYDMTISSFFKDVKEYGSHFIWCLGCQCAMVARVVIYNLERGIPYVYFASSVGGQYAVMSMPITHKNWKRFYADYGIDFQTPLIERKIEKHQERKLLSDLGVWLGVRFNRSVIGVQPLCVPGWQHILDILFHVHTQYDPVEVDRYFHDKEHMMKKNIEDYFKSKNLDVQELVEKVKQKRREIEGKSLEEKVEVEKIPVET